MNPPDTEGRPESRSRAGRPPVPGIAEAQRRRLCDAVCAVFAERGGYGGATEEMLLSGLAWRIGTALEEGDSLAPLAPGLAEFTLAQYPGSDRL